MRILGLDASTAIPYQVHVLDGPTHTIVETIGYRGQVDRLSVTATERDAINDQYASRPDYGAVIKHTGGLRKGRVAKDTTGKSGGYRVFSFFVDLNHPVFLIWIIDKTKNDTLTDAQEQAFRKLTTMLKAECR